MPSKYEIQQHGTHIGTQVIGDHATVVIQTPAGSDQAQADTRERLDRMETRLEQVYQLLLTLFESAPDHFRRWIRFGPEGDSTNSALPDRTVPTATLLYEGLLAVHARGLLTSVFFARLLAEFPSQRTRIEGVAKNWVLSGSESEVNA